MVNGQDTLVVVRERRVLRLARLKLPLYMRLLVAHSNLERNVIPELRLNVTSGIRPTLIICQFGGPDNFLGGSSLMPYV